MGPKFRFPKNAFPTTFFTHKTCFTTFHTDWSQNINKKFLDPIFQKYLQVIVPLCDQKFNFRKMRFRQLFSLTKHVSQHFILIKPKKSTKNFRPHFSKNNNKLLSPYGTKISISEKCVSGNFFHSQNMFHNISYWLNPKNQRKNFRPHFSKIITS